ncbi:MAG: SEC-C metal-binding domain-containing protein [Rhodanobacter sp.]|jgi:tetratricopeptide (TPR) repeat protein
MNTNELSPELFDFAEGFWRYCVVLIARGAAYPNYVDAVKLAHGQLPAELREEALFWPIASCMAREVWRRTPHPASRYALGTLPAPERNAPCPCGSGRKYKQCCLLIEHDMPKLEMNLLPMVLDTLPRRRWVELAGSRVPTDMVFDAAQQMNQDHREKETCALLEPWFVDDADFHARREGLFDMLLDAYTGLGKPRRKAQLLDRALAVGDRRMQSAALQRQSTMLADAGDYAAAWEMFGQAQRADPASSSLAHLEITLLISEGRQAEARDRARFWAHRLTARRDPALDGIVAFMHEIAAHGEQALTQFMLDSEPDLQELVALLQAAPPVVAQYTLSPGDEGAGPLKPKPALKKALRSWDAAAPQIGHSPLFDNAALGPAAMADWLPVLRQHPILWNAFEVLDTIVETMRAWRVELLIDTVVLPVLDRAEQLLREVLRLHHAEGLRLEWGWLENRPALSLLGNRVAIDWDEPPSEFGLARLEWLVLTLNPGDNQGFRHTLVRAYLQHGRVDDAVALCESYPDDFAAMQYNHALALFAAGKTGLALTALRKGVDAYPKLLTWLLKANPKEPAHGKWGVQMGGDEEAWMYRTETLALWRQLDAMDWLRDCAKAFKKRV